jgi:hypothetical protein
MKFPVLSALLIISAFLFNSCSSSNDVVSSHSIQKRKYRKGFFVSGANSSTAQSNTAKQNTQLILDQTELATAETIEIKSPERNSILEIQPIKDRTQKSATIDSPKEASAVKKIFQRGVTANTN